MKISEERLFEIAVEEYKKAGKFPKGNAYYAWVECVGEWALESSNEEYESEEEVREELKEYIKDIKITHNIYH